MKLIRIVSRFLDLFRLEEYQEPAPPPQRVTITEREILEKQVHYILTSQDYEYPETVAYMSDAMLNQIISNYLKS